MRVFAFLLALVLGAPAWAAEAPRAVATASKTEVSVGERFAVELRATGPEGTTFEFPAEAVRDSFELHSEPPADTIPAGVHRYRAAVFALGEARVPPIPVRYRLPDGTTGQIETAPIPLRVVSLLPKERDEHQLADIRGPVHLSVGRTFWLALIAAILVAAAVATIVVRRLRRRAAVVLAPIPSLAPDEEARRALDALHQSGRLSRGEYRPFYIELTAIAKRYLERRLEAPIVEMTTAEMLAHLRGEARGAALAPTLRDLSGAADQIKFARGSGLGEEAERHLAAVRALIENLEARMRPAAPEGGQAA